ncbi:MAG: rod shape-determining protein MreC [Rhodospirillales bacterium]|nr:rod shape-determining protein MreC [Rhodospirillales bacterium]
MAQRTAFTPTVTLPSRAFGERFSSVILTMTAVALIVTGRVDPALVEHVRSKTADFVTPLLTVIQQPLATARDVVDRTEGILNLATENARLREENENLKKWEATALSLEAQSRVLRGMVNLSPSAPAILRTEPVIAEPGGLYARSVLIGGGAHDGLAKGQAAMAGVGLAGRITEIGAWSARVLLITDLNSRIPVILEGTRTHAILAGDNSPSPYLMYLPKAAAVLPGDRLVTAGHDGVFPTGLPVGRVASIENAEIRVEPIADLDRLEYLELVDSVAQSALTPEIAPAESRGFFGTP